MTVSAALQLIVNIIIILTILSIFLTGILLLFKDKRQKQHSVLRNYPLLARIRYFLEKVGPEMRQYLFLQDTKGKPFSRNDYTNIVLAGKNNSRPSRFSS